MDLIDNHIANSALFYMKNYDAFKAKVAALKDPKAKNATMVLYYLTKHYYKRNRNNAEID